MKNIIFEKNSRPGGLLDSFSIKGFTFDHFIHLSFAKNQYVKKFFAKSSKFYTHNPNPNFLPSLAIFVAQYFALASSPLGMKTCASSIITKIGLLNM